MSEMRVECYAGYRADQRPIRFILRGHKFEIIEVQDQWYSPGAVYFRVRTDDGDFFVTAARRTAGCLEPGRVPFRPRAADVAGSRGSGVELMPWKSL